MPFIYEVRSNNKNTGTPTVFYYANEGDALQAAKRSACKQTNERMWGNYKIEYYQVSIWTDELMVLADKEGRSLVHVYRHPVL